MGDYMQELEASVKLIWEYASEACPPGHELRPDILNGKEVLLAAPKLLDALRGFVYFPDVWANDPDGKIRAECWQETMEEGIAAIAQAEES